jgi:hypothetical protein
MLSYHFGEERFRRHDPKGIVREHFNNIRLPYEYTTDLWEEEEVHQNSRTYDEVIFNRHGQRREELQMKKKKEKQPGKRKNKKKLGTFPLFPSQHTRDL